MSTKPKRLFRGGSLTTRSWLYDAGDHLVYLEGYYQERVRRFYYRDIQTALWTVNRAAMWGRVILLLLITLPGVGLLINGAPEAAAFFLIPALLIFLRLLYVGLRGGYCRFCLVTAAQGQQLVGVQTVPKALNLVEKIESKLDSLAV